MDKLSIIEAKVKKILRELERHPLADNGVAYAHTKELLQTVKNMQQAG